MAKEAVWVSGVVDSFAEAEALMSRVGKVSMSDSSIWRRVERWGQAFQELEQARQERANALPNRGEVVAAEAETERRMGVAMDGAMVHIRDEGWKELKVGTVYDIELRLTFDKQSQEWLDLGHAVNNSYIPHLGGPEVFGQLLWAEAQARGWERVYDTQAMGDGAIWIWNLVSLHFFDSRQCVDWYHASHHLHDAAALLYPQEPEAAKRWYNQAETTLFQGHADQISAQLAQQAHGNSQRAKDLRTEAGYFDHNKRRMQYLELREEGYPLGSGMVESGAKQFKARFCGPGMRWSRAGIERLLPIRAAILSHQFDTLWPDVYNSPIN